MKVQTKWFGEIDTDESKIFTFEKGLIGFDDCKKYTIVYDAADDEDASIVWLQSLDEVALALPIMKPEFVMLDYDPVVEDELVKSLGDNIKDAKLLVFVALTVPEDIKKMTANLKAPIILNVDTMKGIQVIADNDDYLVRYPIYDVLNAGKDGK